MGFLEGNMCRICLGRKDLVDLYSTDSPGSISSKLASLSNIQMNQNDGFPPYICVSCIQNLEVACNFIKKSEDSDIKLRSDYIHNSYSPLTLLEMPSNFDYNNVIINCKVEVDVEDNEEQKYHFEPSENVISFEECSELKKKIAKLTSMKINFTKKMTTNKAVDYLKSNTNLIVKKVSGKLRGDKAPLIKSEDLSSDDASVDANDANDASDYEPPANDFNADDSDEDEMDKDYVPIKVSKINKGVRVRSRKLKMKSQRFMMPKSNKPKYEKMTRSLESRFKITPKIIQLSKYKNCNTSNKGPRGIAERMIKVYRPRNHLHDGNSKRGRKPVLDRDETGRIIRPKHQCYVCGVMAADIKQHMTSHTGEKSHVCDVCDRRFSTRGNLIHHKKIHSGIKSHVCQVCGAAFIYASCLQRHLDIHTGTKPHKCHLCDKAFQLAQGLKRHLTVHEGARPHACHMCPARFNQPHQLKTHIRSHTGEKPYVCQECGEAFTYKYVLNNHVKKHLAQRMDQTTSAPGLNVEVNGSTINVTVTGNGNNGMQQMVSSGQQMVLAPGLTSLHGVHHMAPDIIQNGNLVQHITTSQGLVGLVQANIALGPPVCSQ
ncbi:zinc finger protein 252-like [Ctenocephalides felis]|uniref:zinc finger protein 252-like n=1 Tax=Ctenocephalides felis TaxID=7515 RepID=UPI000E6E29B2|nr:zinc finger protein 252-like [Ctenocephalides felis]